ELEFNEFYHSVGGFETLRYIPECKLVVRPGSRRPRNLSYVLDGSPIIANNRYSRPVHIFEGDIKPDNLDDDEGDINNDTDDSVGDPSSSLSVYYSGEDSEEADNVELYCEELNELENANIDE